MDMSEKEKRELAIRRHMEAERRNQYSLATTTTNGNNNIWKLAIIILGGGAVLASLCGIAYLIGQNSIKNNRCKC